MLIPQGSLSREAITKEITSREAITKTVTLRGLQLVFGHVSALLFGHGHHVCVGLARTIQL